MAIIGSIRNRLGGLLVVLVGGALVLFVVGDFFDNSGSRSMGDSAVGTINGEDIELQTFDNRVKERVFISTAELNQTVGNEQEAQIRNEVWNSLVSEKVMMPQVEAAGFGSSLCKEEYDDVRFGDQIGTQYDQNQQVMGPDGKVDRSKVKQLWESAMESTPNAYGMYKKGTIESRLYAKYNTLVKKSVWVNSAQAKEEFEQKNLKATFNFVVKPFSAEPDSLYAVSEEDLKRYYDAHKNLRKYKQKASRSFSYVSMAVLPSEADRQNQMRQMRELAGPFHSAGNDSLFVATNSDDHAYNLTPYKDGTADKLNDSLIVYGDTGTVVGPFVEGENIKLVKVIELADVPEARVRHILLKSDASNDAQKKQQADSLLSVLKRDRSKFDELVPKFTEDPNSIPNKGVYEWFDKKQMVPEFTAASFDQKVGAITVCKTTYGYHIVEVLGQRTRKERRVAAITRKVVPSVETGEAVWKTANAFQLEHKTLEAFEAGAKEAGLEVKKADNVTIDQTYVAGIAEPKDVLSWSSRAELGDVSNPMRIGDQYIVAILRSIKEEGAPELEDVREGFTKEVVKEKKAEAYSKLMTGKTDLSALAAELQVGVQTATDLTFGSFNIPGGFSENEAIGRIFALNQGQLSQPIVGDMGVYMVQLTSITPAPELSDVSAERKGVLDRSQQSAEGRVFSALREAADIQDLRNKFY